MRVRSRPYRHALGQGDDLSPTQEVYTDDEGMSSLANPDLTTPYSATGDLQYNASENTGAGAAAAAQGVGGLAASGIGALLSLVPWYVWAGGALWAGLYVWRSVK